MRQTFSRVFPQTEFVIPNLLLQIFITNSCCRNHYIATSKMFRHALIEKVDRYHKCPKTKSFYANQIRVLLFENYSFALFRKLQINTTIYYTILLVVAPLKYFFFLNRISGSAVCLQELIICILQCSSASCFYFSKLDFSGKMLSNALLIFSITCV